jgi:hypothetical protein
MSVALKNKTEHDFTPLLSDKNHYYHNQKPFSQTKNNKLMYSCTGTLIALLFKVIDEIYKEGKVDIEKNYEH